MADEPITDFERQLYAGKSIDDLVTSNLRTHEKELDWMTALLMEFKKQRTGRYRRNLRPRVERLFYKIKHFF